MSINSEPTDPDPETAGRLREIFERAGLLRRHVSTADFEAVEGPLAGPLLSKPEREILRDAQHERASRFFGIRPLQAFWDWFTSDDPNISDGETGLNVPDYERRHSPVRTEQEEADLKLVVDAFEDFVPRRDDTYAGIFYQRPEGESMTGSSMPGADHDQ
jgi:hypothetical protein